MRDDPLNLDPRRPIGLSPRKVLDRHFEESPPSSGSICSTELSVGFRGAKIIGLGLTLPSTVMTS